MILVHIITKEEKQAMDIIELLTQRKLLLNPMMSGKKVFLKDPLTGRLTTSSQSLVIGKTRSLLFDSIDKLLKEKYPSQMPVLYCLPIVYMNHEGAKELLEGTAKLPSISQHID